MTFITKKSMQRRTLLKGLGRISGAADAGFDDSGSQRAGSHHAAAGMGLRVARRHLRSMEADDKSARASS